jgi:hypothetical protein
MKTLKKGILLAVVLLVATILVTGCSPEPSVQMLPAGTVYLSLVIDNPNPSLNMRATFDPDTTIDTFQQFRLEFLPTSGGAGTVVEYWDNRADPGPPPVPPKRSGTISLVAGIYTLEIIAYTDFSATPTTIPPSIAAATATMTGIDVTATSQNLGAVTLRAYDPREGEENGTFAWNIDASGITAPITVASMIIRNLAGTAIRSFDLLPDEDGWVNLDGVSLLEGYYNVDFTITAGLTRTFRHILHIYRGQTTTVSYEFTDAVLGLVTLSVTITNITYTPPAPIQPVVQTSVDDNPDPPVVTTIAAGDEVTVTRGVNDTTLLLSNAASYASIVWWFNGTAIPGDTCLVDTITTTSAFYNIPAGRYPLSVTGTTPVVAGNPYSGAPSSTEIFIMFVVP